MFLNSCNHLFHSLTGNCPAAQLWKLKFTLLIPSSTCWDLPWLFSNFPYRRMCVCVFFTKSNPSVLFSSRKADHVCQNQWPRPTGDNGHGAVPQAGDVYNGSLGAPSLAKPVWDAWRRQSLLARRPYLLVQAYLETLMRTLPSRRRPLGTSCLGMTLLTVTRNDHSAVTHSQ